MEFKFQPSNVVVTGPLPGGRVKLCDFGLSRHVSSATEVTYCHILVNSLSLLIE